MFRRSDESIISIQSNPFVNHGSHERQDPNQRRDRNAQHSVFAVYARCQVCDRDAAGGHQAIHVSRPPPHKLDSKARSHTVLIMSTSDIKR